MNCFRRDPICLRRPLICEHQSESDSIIIFHIHFPHLTCPAFPPSFISATLHPSPRQLDLRRACLRQRAGEGCRPGGAGGRGVPAAGLQCCHRVAGPSWQHSFSREPEERPATKSRLRRAQERAEERVRQAERALQAEQKALSNPPPVISW